MANIKKTEGRRLNFLILRKKGPSINVSLPILLILVGLVLAATFSTVSVLIIQRYYHLRLDYQALYTLHVESERELKKLHDLYSYQTQVAEEYASLVKGVGEAGGDLATVEAEASSEEVSDNDEMIWPSLPPLKPGELSRPAAGGTFSPGSTEPTALDVWLASFFDPGSEPAQKLDIERFQANEAGFKFHLLNRVAGSQVQGYLLCLFLVETPDGDQFLPFPDFNFRSREPDFSVGISYNIRSSKPVSGRLALSEGGRIKEMAVVVKSRAGQIVLKKKLIVAD